MCTVMTMELGRLVSAATWAVLFGAVLSTADSPAAAQSAAPLATAQLQTGASTDRRVAILGQELVLALAPSSASEPSVSEFDVVADADGPLTVDAASFDADVALEHLSDDGAVLERTEGGGIGWNARVVVMATSGQRLRFRVCFPWPVPGKVAVRAQAGDVLLPTGFELGQATAEFHLGCAEAGGARGDVKFAASEYHLAGQAFFNLGLYADSQRAYRTGLPLLEQLGDARKLTYARGYLGAVAVRFGSAAEARDLLVPACEGAVAAEERDFEMFCRSNLAEARSQLGDLAGAVSECDRALDIARAAKNPEYEASMLSQRALLAMCQGDAPMARDLHASAVQAAEIAGDPNRLAQMLWQLAYFHEVRGELADAEKLLARALDQATLPAIRAGIAGELGNVRTEQGRWPEAMVLRRTALDIAREIGDSGLQATALANLGVVEGLAGNLSAAEGHLNQALALNEQSGAAAGQVHALLELASLRYEADRLAEAAKLLERAVAIADTAASDELSMSVLYRLALLEAKDPDRLREASEHADRMLELAHRSGSRDREADALNMQAWTRHLAGRDDEAAEIVAQAVEMSRGSSPERLAAALSTRIDIALAQRDLPGARHALDEARKLLRDVSVGGTDIEAASLARSSWSYAQFSELEQDVLALALGASRPDAKERSALVADGFRAADRAQSLALLEGISEHRSGHRDAQVIALRQERTRLLADRNAVLDAIAAAGGAGALDPESDLVEREQQLRDQADAALERLRQLDPGEAALDLPPDVDVAQVQLLLREADAVLVQYVEGQVDLFAYVLTPSSLEWHDLGPRSAVASRTRDVLDGISNPAQLDKPAVVAAHGQSAWRALLQPLLPPDGVNRLIVVPTPSLAALPFEALVTAANPAPKTFDDLTFLIDRSEVCYVPSTAVMSLLATAPPRTAPPRTLVLADAVVPGEASAAASVPREVAESAPWLRLPGTRTEALAIFDLLHVAVDGIQDKAELPSSERGGHLESGLVDVYLGPEATVDRLQDDARRYSIVHIAAHGAIDASEPGRTGLVLSARGDDDGFLSVPEVLDLDLDADLVVLSACDTARGVVRRGEGVQSLARAFMYAGARDVVATLWQVDDKETEVAMRSLYEGLKGEGRGAASALRQARLQLRRPGSEATGFVGLGRGNPLPGSPARVQPSSRAPAERRGHPYFWAPFIDIGWGLTTR